MWGSLMSQCPKRSCQGLIGRYYSTSNRNVWGLKHISRVVVDNIDYFGAYLALKCLLCCFIYMLGSAMTYRWLLEPWCSIAGDSLCKPYWQFWIIHRRFSKHILLLFSRLGKIFWYYCLSGLSEGRWFLCVSSHRSFHPGQLHPMDIYRKFMITLTSHCSNMFWRSKHTSTSEKQHSTLLLS